MAVWKKTQMIQFVNKEEITQTNIWGENSIKKKEVLTTYLPLENNQPAPQSLAKNKKSKTKTKQKTKNIVGMWFCASFLMLIFFILFVGHFTNKMFRQLTLDRIIQMIRSAKPRLISSGS